MSVLVNNSDLCESLAYHIFNLCLLINKKNNLKPLILLHFYTIYGTLICKKIKSDSSIFKQIF